MDLYFQGMAWLYKGLTPRYMAQSRSYFDRALIADPNNVDALITLAGVEAIEGVNSFATDPVASFSAAEAKLTQALSSVPDHAVGHMWLARLRGFGHFLGVLVKEINILTEKVFTTGGVGREARRRRFWGAAGPAA